MRVRMKIPQHPVLEFPDEVGRSMIEAGIAEEVTVEPAVETAVYEPPERAVTPAQNPPRRRAGGRH